MVMKSKEEILIAYYYMGVELSQEEKPFPNWFEFYEEKVACLKGYNDATLNTVKTNDEDILKEIFGNVK